MMTRDVINRLIAYGVLIPNLALVASAQGRSPSNLDFTASDVGQPPMGWFVPFANKGFPASVTNECARPGRQCVALRSEQVSSPGPFGNLMQSLDASDYRGRQLRYRASVRVRSAKGAHAALWLRVDRPNGQFGFFDNMGDRPITSPSWASYEIKGEVTEDAIGVSFGVMLLGEGLAFIDEVSFEATGTVEYAPVVERSRPLSARGLINVTAFARLVWIRAPLSPER